MSKKEERIPIIFSTITGNAVKLAMAIKDYVPNYIGPYDIAYINSYGPYKINYIDFDLINKFKTIILVYWCNRGTVDNPTMELINKFKNKDIIILGTLGVKTDTQHAKNVLKAVEDLVKKENNLTGNFLCQGSIDLFRTSLRLSIPEGEKGHLSKERFQKQHESLGHPNNEELEMAVSFIKEIFNT